jgi:hypothetical protein
MKKFIITTLSVLLSVYLKGQFCSQTTLVNMGNIIPTGVNQSVTGAASAKRYWTFTATAGCTYTLSTCTSINSNDTYLRLYSGTNPASAILVTSNDDNGPICAGSKASIVWTCVTSGPYSILVTNYTCANLSASTNLVFRVVCGAPAFNPCTGSYPTITCGVNVNSTILSGNGGYNPPSTTCGFSTPGQEKIYVFTPTVTGTYTINQTASFNYIDYFFKPVSGGCSGTGWTCIDDLFGTSSSIPFNLTQGVQYYIMLDPETTGGGNVTFNIGCPSAGPVFNPCTGSYPTITCGVNVNWTILSGNGGYNPPSTTCGFSTPGQEKIYVFTPTVTGTYTINQTTSFDYIDYFFKPVSGGCSGTGWTCIDDLFGTSSSIPFNLTQGIQYYIMLDPEVTTGGNVTFNIGCPSAIVVTPPNDNCANAINISSLPFTSPVVSTNNSTSDVPTSTTNCGTFGANLWYSVLGNGTTYTATTCNASTNYDTEIRVYTGACASLNSMTEIVCNDDDGVCGTGATKSTVNWCSVNGTTYFITVGYFVNTLTYGNFVLNVTSGAGCQVLPIELMSFEGYNNKEYNVITWVTASESNNDYFTLQRSLDAFDWETIEIRKGAGTSQLPIFYEYKDYSYIKDSPNYYRLVQSDYDGTKTNSPIIVITSKIEKKCNQYQYYDLLGREINIQEVTSGIYLRRCGDKIEKIIKS